MTTGCPGTSHAMGHDGTKQRSGSTYKCFTPTDLKTSFPRHRKKYMKAFHGNQYIYKKREVRMAAEALGWEACLPCCRGGRGREGGTSLKLEETCRVSHCKRRKVLGIFPQDEICVPWLSSDGGKYLQLSVTV